MSDQEPHATPPPSALSVQSLLEAMRFLTVLPLPLGAPLSERTTAASVLWFPVVGLLIGGLLVSVGWLAGTVWGDMVRAATLVVAWVVLTGGLHMDGLSDTADGVASWRPRDRKLEIMRDSCVGAMGVLAIVAVLLLKFALLHDTGAGWWRGVLLAPVWGRWAAVYGITRFPVARASGLGQRFKAQVQQRTLLVATVVALLMSLLIGGGAGLLAALLVWGSMHLVALWLVYDLGGLTGDTYGAMIELSEVIALLALTW